MANHFLASIFSSIAGFAVEQTLLAFFGVFITTIFLGNIGAFAALWLAFQGTLGPWGIPAVIIILFFADLTADLIWYSLGRTLSGTKLGEFIESHLPGAKKIQEYLQKRGVHLIFLAKFLYASNFPILFSVGWTKMEFKKYMRASVLAVALWVPTVTILASVLFAGLSAVRARAFLKHLEIVFLVGLVLFVALNSVLKWLVKRSLQRGAR